MRVTSSRPQSIVLKYKYFATHLLVGAACFYVGIGVGVRVGFVDCSKECQRQEKSAHLLKKLQSSFNDGSVRSLKSEGAASADNTRFPKNVAEYMTGVGGCLGPCFFLGISQFSLCRVFCLNGEQMSQVDRVKFTTRFDVGVPLDQVRGPCSPYVGEL
jgi:hypothetical protein